MNTFSAKLLLSEDTKFNYDKLAQVTVRERGFLEQMLEFNESLTLAEIESSRKFYRSLLESDIVISEGVLESLADFIKEIIKTIAEFFTGLFGGGKGGDGGSGGSSKTTTIESAKKNYKKFEKLSKEVDKNNIADDTIKVKKYEYPTDFTDRTIKEIADVIALSQTANTLLKQAAAGNASDDTKEEIRKLIEEIKAKQAEVEDTLTEIKEKKATIIQGEEVEVPMKQYVNEQLTFFKSNSDITKAVAEDKIDKSMPTDFEGITKALKEYEKTISSNQKLGEYSDVIREMNSTLATFSATCCRLYEAKASAFYITLNKDLSETNRILIRASNGVVEVQEESGGWIRTTRFMEASDPCPDISTSLEEAIITEDYAYREVLNEIEYKRIAQEAMIFASDKTAHEKFLELYNLNEGIVNKIKRAFTVAIEKIKKIFAKFMEKLRGNFTTTKHYLDKYKNVILKQTWVDRTYKTRDIIDGMKRTMNFEVPYLNYDFLAKDLKDPIDFFQKEFVNPKNMGQFNGQAVADIGPFVKDWLLGGEVNYNAKTVQNNIKDIYDYMYDIRKIENSINKSIDDIKKSCDEAMKKAGIDINQDAPPAEPEEKQGEAPPAKPANAVQDKKQNVSGADAGNAQSAQSIGGDSAIIYSALHGRPINELEVVTNGNNAGNAGGGNTQQSTSMTGQVASNMTNVGEKKENDAGTSGHQRPLVETDCKNYADVCVAVLTAKLTAIEFMRSEFFQIIRMHVNDYIGNQTNTRQGESENINLKPNPKNK